MPEKTYLNTPKITCPLCDYEHPEKQHKDAIITCGNCMGVFDTKVTVIKTERRVQDKEQTLPHDEYLFFYSTCPHIEPKIDLATISSWNEAVNLYKKKLITNSELSNLLHMHSDWKVIGFVDGFENKFLRDDANPFYSDDDNTARQHGMKYSPYHHPNGILFQSHVKYVIRQIINLTYGSLVQLYGRKRTNRLKRFLLKQALNKMPGIIGYLNKTMSTHYDKDSFVVNDPFLSAIRNISYKHIKENMQWEAETEEPAIKAMDIVITLLKEDMPYRINAKGLLNEIIRQHPNGFELSDDEAVHSKNLKEAIAKKKTNS